MTTISEAIEALERIREEHGDVDFGVLIRDEGMVGFEFLVSVRPFQLGHYMVAAVSFDDEDELLPPGPGLKVVR